MVPVNQFFNSQQMCIHQSPELAEKISPYLVIDIQANAKNHHWNYQMYRIAAITSAVFFTIAAVSAFTLCSIYVPQYAFFAAGGTLYFLSIFYQYVYFTFDSKAHVHYCDFEALQKIALKNNALNELDNSAFLAKYRQIEAPFPKEETLEKLAQIDSEMPIRSCSRLLARFEYWREVSERIHQKKQEELNTIRQLFATMSAELSPEKRQEIQIKITDSQMKCYELEEHQYLPTKIFAAFMLYVLSYPDMLHPQTNKPVDIFDFGKIFKQEYLSRSLSRDFPPSQNLTNFYYVVADEREKIPREWLLQSSIREIANKIFLNSPIFMTT